MGPKSNGTMRLPLLPLRDIIVFPHMVVPLFVGRDRSLSALEEAMAGDKQLLLAAQRRAKTDDPAEEDIFSIGTVGHIIQLLRFPKGPVKVLVEGRARARIRGFAQSDPFFVCDVDDVDEPDEDPVETAALMRSVQDVFEDYVKLNTRIPPEMLVSVRTIEEAGRTRWTRSSRTSRSSSKTSRSSSRRLRHPRSASSGSASHAGARSRSARSRKKLRTRA